MFMFAANLGMKLHHFAASTAVQYVLLRAVIKGRGWDQEFLLATVKVNIARRKREPAEVCSCLIPCPLIVIN